MRAFILGRFAFRVFHASMKVNLTAQTGGSMRVRDEGFTRNRQRRTVAGDEVTIFPRFPDSLATSI